MHNPNAITITGLVFQVEEDSGFTFINHACSLQWYSSTGAAAILDFSSITDHGMSQLDCYHANKLQSAIASVKEQNLLEARLPDKFSKMEKKVLES